MDKHALEQHISRISTQWTLLEQAHQGPEEHVPAAQRRIIERYSPAIFRFLASCTGNLNDAEELFQEFALRFLKGGFQHARPERGRFRDYLKTSLRHLVTAHGKKKREVEPLVAASDRQDPGATPAEMENEQFVAAWRAEILDRTWQSLREHEERTGQPFHTVLRFRVDHPKVPSPRMAEQLEAHAGKSVSDVWVRQKLHLARQEFTRLLIDEVRATLDNVADHAELESELTELGLLEHCRAFLDKTAPDGDAT